MTTNEITSEDYRAYARVWKLNEGPVSPDAALVEAARLEAAAARNTEAEELAPVILAGERAHWVSVGIDKYAGGIDALTGDDRVALETGARYALDHLEPIAEWLAAERVYLAGRAFGAAQRESGCKLITADEAADVAILLEHARHLGNPRAVAVRDRLRARFAPAEPAAKQEPRTWPSLDQVPTDVTVTDCQGDQWEHRYGQWRWLWKRKCGDQWMAPSCDSVMLCGPFTEVVDGAQ